MPAAPCRCSSIASKAGRTPARILPPSVPDGVRAEFRKFYYDTASSDHAWTLVPLTKLVEATQVVFGTDFPFRSAAVTAKGLADFGFSAADLSAIDRGNAARLMPSLA